MQWERPSPRVAELIRRGASIFLSDPDLLVAEISEATLEGQAAEVVADPVLVAAMRRTNRANLSFWAEANVRDPGAEVPPNLGPETLGIARDFVRRGLENAALEPYRLGQNVAWTRWMEIAFELTSDPRELRELLAVSARSIFGFVDATIAGILAQIQVERDELTRGTHAERLEVVGLIIGGAPISRRRAAARLGYELQATHTGAVIWSDEPDPDPGALDQAAEGLAAAAGARRPFTVIASAAALWAWVPGATGPDLDVLTSVVEALPGVRLALGAPAAGLDGFRRTHLDAAETQRLLARLDSGLRVASYDAVQLVALLTHDEQRAAEFIRQTLGRLEDADRELRETVRIYLREQSNATRAARLLYAHRNTVLGRLARAESLLPRPLADNSLDVALALEAVHWRGSG